MGLRKVLVPLSAKMPGSFVAKIRQAFQGSGRNGAIETDLGRVRKPHGRLYLPSLHPTSGIYIQSTREKHRKPPLSYSRHWNCRPVA